MILLLGAFDLGHLSGQPSNSDPLMWAHWGEVLTQSAPIPVIVLWPWGCALNARNCENTRKKNQRTDFEHDTQITQWLTWHDMDWNMDCSMEHFDWLWLTLIVMGAIWSRGCIHCIQYQNRLRISQGQAEQALLAESPVSFDSGVTALDKIWHNSTAAQTCWNVSKAAPQWRDIHDCYWLFMIEMFKLQPVLA